MLLKVLSLVCLVALCHSLPSPDKIPEDALYNIFGTGSESPSQSKLTYGNEKELEEKGYKKCSESRVCVPYYLCDYNGLEKTTTSTELPLDTHTIDYNIRMPIDVRCSSYHDVCCDDKYVWMESTP